MLELFQMAPKPPQMMWGNVSEGTPGYDVRRCRRSALEENQEPVPIFGLQDKWEDYDSTKDYDFYYVDDGEVPQDDLVDLSLIHI